MGFGLWGPTIGTAGNIVIVEKTIGGEGPVFTHGHCLPLLTYLFNTQLRSLSLISPSLLFSFILPSFSLVAENKGR